MASPSIGLGLIVHPRDAHLLPPFIATHQTLFDALSIVLDSDGCTEQELAHAVALIRGNFTGNPENLYLQCHGLCRDFAAQRNLCARLNPCDWMLMLDADERIRVRLQKLLRPALAEVLKKHQNVRVLGLARDNVLDGHSYSTSPDWQFRLVRRDVRWRNTQPCMNASPGCHEEPLELHDNPGAAMLLKSMVIIHDKSVSRQLEQNAFYETCA